MHCKFSVHKNKGILEHLLSLNLHHIYVLLNIQLHIQNDFCIVIMFLLLCKSVAI